MTNSNAFLPRLKEVEVSCDYFMKEITFRYADELSNWQWRTQHCVVESVEECIRVYGLGVDCEYEILEVKEKK